MALKFTKIRAGWYATEDGRYAVVSDGLGYISQAETNGSGVNAGVANDGWAAVFDPQGRLREDHNEGDNIDWLDTKREAVERAEEHRAARERFNAALDRSSPALWRE